MLKKIFTIEIPNNRLFGLDLMRAMAILFVMFGHSIFFLPENIKSHLHAFVVDGVSLFFVLSGFLIGSILIRDFERGINLKVIFNFWIRRWFRTIPIYFLILSFLIILTGFEKPSFFYFNYFVFIENFFSPMPDFFSEAWSLSIEEWFYLITPIILLLLKTIFKEKPLKTLILLTALFFIAGTLYLRFYRYYKIDIPKGFPLWDSHFNRQIITRLDSLMFGVLAAVLKHYFPHLFQYKKKIQLLLGITLVIFLQYYIHTHHNFVIYTIYFTLNSLGIMLMLPFFSDYNPFTNKKNFFYKIITYTSLISYSLYLVNFTLISTIIIPYINTIYENTILNITVFWGLSSIISVILYKYFELPTTKLRDHLKKTK